jgi:hypothetical protein
MQMDRSFFFTVVKAPVNKKGRCLLRDTALHLGSVWFLLLHHYKVFCDAVVRIDSVGRFVRDNDMDFRSEFSQRPSTDNERFKCFNP